MSRTNSLLVAIFGSIQSAPISLEEAKNTVNVYFYLTSMESNVFSVPIQSILPVIDPFSQSKQRFSFILTDLIFIIFD